MDKCPQNNKSLFFQKQHLKRIVSKSENEIIVVKKLFCKNTFYRKKNQAQKPTNIEFIQFILIK